MTDYGYNANNWLTGIAAKKLLDTVYSSDYQFDKVGNITQKANDASTPLSTSVTTTYGYDRIYQLLNSTNPMNSETFTYDKVGNRKTKQGTQTPWTYNRNNELQAADTVSYGYDANGNTIAITSSTNSIDSTTSFIYNAQDRLQSVQLPDGRTATYSYDPFGRRIRKAITPSPLVGEGGGEGGTTLYIYADEGLIGEYTETGAMKKTYGWRPGGIWGTNPLFMAEGGSYYFYHNDHLGTPQGITDMAGNIVWEASYEAFGKATVDLESTVTNNLRFPGQYWDEETGNHYNWNRYYDPASGRYVSKDPIGFKGRDANLFRYVQNNVINFGDATGLKMNGECLAACLADKTISLVLDQTRIGALLPFDSNIVQTLAGYSSPNNFVEAMVDGSFLWDGAAAMSSAVDEVVQYTYNSSGGDREWKKYKDYTTRKNRNNGRRTEKTNRKYNKAFVKIDKLKRIAIIVPVIGNIVSAIDYASDIHGCIKKCDNWRCNE